MSTSRFKSKSRFRSRFLSRFLSMSTSTSTSRFRSRFLFRFMSMSRSTSTSMSRSSALSDSLHRALVRYGKRDLDFTFDRVPQLCATFPFLCSLSISGLSTAAHLTALFASLSSLPALLHLELNVDLNLGLQDQPLQQLQVPVSSSVRALDLWLTAASCRHPLLARLWLALMAWSLPELQVLCLKDLRCTACATSLQALTHRNFTGGVTTDLETAIGCVHQSLQRFQRFQGATAAAAAAAAAAAKGRAMPISLMVYDAEEERTLPVSEFLANLLDMLFQMRNRGGPAVAAQV